MKTLAVLTAMTLSTAAYCDSWVYQETLAVGPDTGVMIYIDQHSVRPAAHLGNRLVSVALTYPKSEVTVFQVEVNCNHQTIKHQGVWSGTQPGGPLGRMVRTICRAAL